MSLSICRSATLSRSVAGQDILEIVHWSINELPQKVHVITCDLANLTAEIKIGYIVEGLSILNEDVYKKITLRGGSGENRIEIMEFKLCSDPRKEHLKLDHQEFLYGLVTYFFDEIEGKQFVKVWFVGFIYCFYSLCVTAAEATNDRAWQCPLHGLLQEC